jgi:hypothetical protein
MAEQLSRRGRVKASAELCNEAVGALVRLCYEADTDGNAANVDGATGRILIALPWGRVSQKWGKVRPPQPGGRIF